MTNIRAIKSGTEEILDGTANSAAASVLEDAPSKEELRESLRTNFLEQGFDVDAKMKITCRSESKEQIRDLHSKSVEYLVDRSQRLIKRYENEFIEKFIADGSEVEPSRIRPKLVEVTDEYHGGLFRWVRLHWSIPTSAGYGRRLRYLVIDEQNDKLIGIIGLGDPVFAMRDRDNFIGWSREQKSVHLRNIMEAFVLGAVPPYSHILGGKLVASLASSAEVANRFKEKYGGTTSLISERKFDGTLVAITTASALGKSSIYDRLRIPNGSEYLHAGWSSGSGEFPFINGDYAQLRKFAKDSGGAKKNEKWGPGVRSRRYVVTRALKDLNLPRGILYHGIQRELFIVPLGRNWREYLQGTDSAFVPCGLSTGEISDFMRARWMIPRSERDKSFVDFGRESYRLGACDTHSG